MSTLMSVQDRGADIKCVRKMVKNACTGCPSVTHKHDNHWFWFYQFYAERSERNQLKLSLLHLSSHLAIWILRQIWPTPSSPSNMCTLKRASWKRWRDWQIFFFARWLQNFFAHFGLPLHLCLAQNTAESCRLDGEVGAYGSLWELLTVFIFGSRELRDTWTHRVWESESRILMAPELSLQLRLPKFSPRARLVPFRNGPSPHTLRSGRRRLSPRPTFSSRSLEHAAIRCHFQRSLRVPEISPDIKSPSEVRGQKCPAARLVMGCLVRPAFGSSPQASPALSRRWRSVQNSDLCWIGALSAHWTDLSGMVAEIRVGTSHMLAALFIGCDSWPFRFRNTEGLRCPDPCPAWPGLSGSVHVVSERVTGSLQGQVFLLSFSSSDCGWLMMIVVMLHGMFASDFLAIRLRPSFILWPDVT